MSSVGPAMIATGVSIINTAVEMWQSLSQPRKPKPKSSIKKDY